MLEALGGLVQQFRRHVEIDLGMPDMNVTQRHRQMLQEALYIGILPIPGRQAVNGKGMTFMPMSA